MKKKCRLGQRILAAVLATAILVPSMPFSTLAAETELPPVQESSVSETVEVVPEESQPPAPEPEAESEQPPVTSKVESSAAEQPKEPAVESTVEPESESDREEPTTSELASAVESKAESKPEAETEPQVRQPKEWNTEEQALLSGIYRARLFAENSMEQQPPWVDVRPSQKVLDLSSTASEQLNEFWIDFMFSFAQDTERVTGDWFCWELPREWMLEDTKKPQPIYSSAAGDLELVSKTPVAAYEIKNHVLTVTLKKTAEGKAKLQALLPLKLSIPAEELNETATTFSFAKEWKVIFPAAPADVSAPESSANESASESSESTTSQTTSEVTSEEQDSSVLASSEAVSEGEAKPAESSETTSQPTEEPSESIGAQVRAFFASLFRGFTEDNKAAADRADESATISKFTIPKAELPDGFDIVKMTVGSKAGGYTKDTIDPVVSFGVEVYPDEDFLFEQSELMMKYPDFPLQGTADWETSVRLWLSVHQNEFPPLTLSYDLGELFGTASFGDQKLKQGEELIATYRLDQGVLKITLDPLCYFADSIFLKFSFDATIDSAKLDDEPKNVIFGDDHKLVLEKVGAAGEEDPEAKKYQISKSAPDRVTDTSIPYEIDIQAPKGKTLNGTWLKDTLSEGLRIQTIQVSLNGGAPFSPAEDEYLADDGKNVLYQFNDDANEILSAKVLLRLQLNDAAYQQCIDEGGISRTFKNDASLLSEDQKAPLAASNEVATKMTTTFLSKSGQEADLAGTRFLWTIELSTHLPALDYGYLVDTLRSTDHGYDFGSGVTIKAAGKPTQIITDIQKISGTVLWDDITADKLHQLAQDAGLAEDQAFYYTYEETGSANPFASLGETTETQRTVLVLPYNGLQGPYEMNGETINSRKVTLQYYSDLNLHGLNQDDYWKALQAANYTTSITNAVNLVWKNRGGVGPGNPYQDQIDINKNPVSSVGTVEKRAVSYNQQKHEMTWAIDVNKLGVNMDDVVVTDVLPKGAYDLSNLKLKYYRYHIPALGEQILADEGECNKDASFDSINKEPGYTLTKDGQGNDVLTVSFGDMLRQDGYDYYTILFTVPLTNPATLANQGKNELKNSASMNFAGALQPVETEATFSVPTTLVKKSTVGTYDHATHTLNWKVTINPEHTYLKDLVATDTLEAGFSFGQVTKATKIGADGTETAMASSEYNLQVTPNPDGDKVVFTRLADGKNTYVFEFTTIASSEWRQDNLESGKDSVIVPNEVVLEGTVVSEANTAVTAPVTNAIAIAEHTVPKRPLQKMGKYDKDTGTIDWTVVVNENRRDIAGLKLEEILTEADAPVIHELDVDSIRITELGTDTDVTATAGSLADVSGNGFTYTFGANAGAANETAYEVTFRTELTGDALGATIKNKVYLKDPQGGIIEESNEHNGGYGGDFNFEENVAAKKRPHITLHKISSNSVEESDDVKSLPLAHAEFTLSAYTYSWDNNTDIVTLGTLEEVRYSKDAESDDDGNLSFYNLKTTNSSAKDLIYVLEEIKAAPGYELDATNKHFFGFDMTMPDTVTIQFNQTPYQGKLQLIDTSASAATAAAKITYTNTPVATSFSFDKKYLSSIVIDETTTPATETPVYSSLAGAVFKIVPTGDLANKVQTRYATADGSGKITLANLDAGSYTMTEVASTTNISVGGTVPLTVAWDDVTKQYTYTLGKSTGGITVDGTTLKDDALRTNFSFTKNIQYADGAKEKEALKDATFLLEGIALGDAGSTVIKKATSASNGKVTFSSIPVGSYKIYELTNPDGYKLESAKVHLYDLKVTDEEDQSKVLGTDGTTTYYAHKAVATATVIRAAVDTGTELRKDTQTTIDNSPIRGTVSFTKQAYDASLTTLNNDTLAGAEFGLFRKIGTTIAKVATYTATSDASGFVQFPSVEYGNYVLKETKAPEGYVKTFADRNITTENLATGFAVDKASFAYEVKPNGQDSIVTNKLYRADLTLTKHQEDGTVLAGVTFDIYRRGNAVTDKAGTGFQTIVPNTQTTFHTYTPLAEVLSDASGNMKLNLPYGDYLLVERDNNLGLQDGHSKPAILISLTNAKTEIYLRDTMSPNPGGNYETATPNAGDWTAVKDKWTQINQNNGKTATVVNHRKYAFLHLTKQTAEASYQNGQDAGLDLTGSQPLAGATFTLEKDNKVFLTLKTDSNGKFVPDADGNYTDANDPSVKKHLVYGDYTLQEKTAPTGFAVNQTMVSFTIDSESDHHGDVWISLNRDTATVTYTKEGAAAPEAEKQTVYNEITRGTLKVTKTNDDGTKRLEGAEFQVLDGTKPVAGLVSDETGVAVLSNRLRTTTFNESKNGIPYLYQTDGEWRLLTGNYTLKEVKAPAGYYPAANQSFEMDTAGQNLTVKNELILSDITLTKVQTGTTTPFAEVAFTLYDSSNAAVETKTTGADGKLTFQKVPAGTYTIRENLAESSKAPGVYINEGWSKQVTVNQSTHKKTIEIGKVENDAFAASLSLQKVDAVDFVGLSDTTFTLERKDGTTFLPYGANQGRYVTNNGALSITGLVKGDYRLTETAAAPGYLLGNEPFSVSFTVTNAEQGKTIAITKAHVDSQTYALEVLKGNSLLTEKGLTNLRQTGTLTLKKVDSVDNTGLDGVTFTLYQKKDGNWLAQVWNFLTGKEYDKIDDLQGSELQTKGELVIKGLLWGDYKLVETGALSGYILDHTEYEFTIGRTQTDMVLTVDQGEIKNVPNRFTIEKRGSDLQPGADGTGDLLDGAEFTITNTKDVTDTHKVTAKNGSIELPKLLTGGATYTITETKAPIGYQLDATPITIIMGTDGVVSGTNVQNNVVTFTDDPTYISFQKVGKINEACADLAEGSFDPDAVKELSGAEFAAYAKDKPDTVVQTAVSNQNGLVEFKKLPLGDYLVKETKAPAGHELDTTVYTAAVTSSTFEGLRKNGELVVKNTVINDVFRTDLQFTKVKEDATDETLPNSTYGLYRKVADGSEELVAKAVTDEQGVLTFRGVLMNTNYVIRELAPPDGSYVSKHPIEITFEADKDGNVTISDFKDGNGTAVQDPITGDIIWLEPSVIVSVEKNAANGQPLTGAALEIQDKDGHTVTSWTSNGTPHAINGLLAVDQAYTLVETKAPDGYYVADPVAFTVENTPVAPGENRVIPLSMTDEQVKYRFLKTDADGQPLAGAELEVQDKDGNVVESWTSETTAHDITGKLIAGESYTLVETKAPNGYYVADSIAFTVANNFSDLADSVVSISMVDEQTKYAILKTDADGQPLAGAELEVQDKDGNVVESWTSETTAHDITGKLIAGEAYTLVETKAPDGYYVADSIAFTVANNFSDLADPIVSISMVNEQTKYAILKTDADGQPLAGAELEVQDKDGNVVESWTSEMTAHDITGKLVAGESYTLVETKAPDGYYVADSIAFTVANNFSDLEEVLISIEMMDNPIVLTLFKTDAVTEERLNGAEFVLEGILVDGSTRKEITSQSNGTDLSLQLVAGERYTLTETKAPEGYVKREHLPNILVGLNGTISLEQESDEALLTENENGFELTISNEKEKPSSETGNGTDTGDGSTLPLWLLLFGVTGGSLLLVLYRKRQELLDLLKRTPRS